MITDESLNSLAVLTLELTKKVDYDDTIDAFIDEKPRRKHF